MDIAGLVKGASKGEGLGNKFLSNIREVDAIVHVVRCFEDGEIVHVEGSIGPRRDIEVINLELIFSDLDILDRRIDKAVKAAKGDKKYLAEVDLLNRVKAHLEEGKSARSMDFTDEEKQIMADIPLLSNKPIIYVANMSDNDFNGKLDSNPFYNEVLEVAREEKLGGRSDLCPSGGGNLRYVHRGQDDVPGGAGLAGIRSGPSDQGWLPPARTHLLPHRRQTGGPRMDHHPRHQSTAGCRQDSQRL